MCVSLQVKGPRPNPEMEFVRFAHVTRLMSFCPVIGLPRGYWSESATKPRAERTQGDEPQLGRQTAKRISGLSCRPLGAGKESQQWAP